MKQKQTKAKRARRNAWRRARRPISAVEWLKALCLAAVIAALAWAGTSWLPDRKAAEAACPVVINRVMTSNPSVCFSVKGRYYDWLELLNTSAEPVSLKGWKLSDSPDQRGAFAFSDITLPGRGSLIVYCAPQPGGWNGSEVFCGFQLNADGELLMLSDDRQRVAQVLDVPAMAASDVYQRDAAGEYAVVSFQSMADSGAVDLRPPFNAAGVIINEVMAANRTTLSDADGDYSDWIELYNGASSPLSLTGCALSDDDVNQRKWVFPEFTLQPGEYKIVFASGKDRREGELHVNFKLSTAGEGLRLYDPEGNVISWVEYDSLEKETSLSRLPDGGVTTELRPTPGYENTEAGSRAALTRAASNAYGLYINEILSTGSGFDWLEVYNAGTQTADLSGMGLSDSTDHPRRWQFPQGTMLPAGGYLAVALTGQEGQSGIENGRFCANFGLAEGETACLSLPNGTLVDRVTLFEQFRDVSYGRAEGQQQFRYFADTTPGAANAAQSYARKASEVSFSQPGGQHSEKQLTVALSSDEDARIYYTTDGTDPTTSSKVYKSPIKLKKNAVIKAVAWRNDVIPSNLCVRSYILGASHTLRIVSVSGVRSKLNGATGMLNTGVKGNGSEAYVEVYEPDGTRIVGQKCLMKLAGHSSRVNETQKGFSLRARKEYGASKFEYPLFSRRDYTWYKSFVMRASGQDCKQTLMRDSVLSSLAEDTRVMYRETEVSVLYVNGQYWGVYNMRERFSQEMAAQFEGWDNPDDVELAEGNGSGSADYRQVMRWIDKHDLSRDENVEKLRERVDIENYLDYVALEMYINNQDLNNVGFYRNPKGDNKWRWAIFDLDLSFQLEGDNIIDWLRGDTAGSITQQSNMLFRKLMQNATMRDYFLTRMGQLLATTFSAENVVGKIQARYELLQPEMKAECERWGWSLATWKRYGTKILHYAKTRPKKMIAWLTDDFDLSQAQAQAYFGEAMAKTE